MLALLSAQQRRVTDARLTPVVWLYFIWGVAWLVGFLALWSSRDDGNPWFTIPAPWGWLLFATLIIGSIVASSIIGIRINRGVSGVSSFSGAVYGLSWMLCGSAFALVGVGLIRNGLSSDLASLYFPAAFALMCGTIYLGGAALWRDRSQLVLAMVLLVAGAVSPFAGAPGNNLVMAFCAGGAFLVAAATLRIRLNRGR